MKKAFLLLCTLLLVLGSLLPLAGYRLAKAVLGEAAASSEVPASSALPAPGGSCLLYTSSTFLIFYVESATVL